MNIGSIWLKNNGFRFEAHIGKRYFFCVLFSISSSNLTAILAQVELFTMKMYIDLKGQMLDRLYHLKIR